MSNQQAGILVLSSHELSICEAERAKSTAAKTSASISDAILKVIETEVGNLLGKASSLWELGIISSSVVST